MLLEVGVVGLLAWLVAGTLLFVFSPASESVQSDVASSGAKSIDFTPLHSHQLFGKIEVVKEVKEAPKPVVVSKLNVRLLGTIVAGDKSAAIVLINGGASQQMFMVGSQIQPGVTLESVEADAIVVDNHGRTERIELPQESARGVSVEVGSVSSGDIHPSSPVAHPRMVGAPVRTAPGRITRPVNRRGLDEQLGNMPQLLTEARVVPHFQDGKQSGYMIRDIVPGSLYEKIGLQNGDVIHSVNGKVVAGPEEAMALYNTLKNESSIVVEVERQGSMQQLQYDIR